MAIQTQTKYLLLAGANQFQRERVIVGALRAYDGIVVGTDTKGVFSQNRLFSDIIQCWDADPQESLRAVLDYEKKTGATPCGVIPVNDFVLNSAEKIAEHYNLPRLSKETIKNCRSKYDAKKIFQENKLPCVTAKIFSNLNEGRKIANELTYPVVIKPYNLGGSCGVIKVNDENIFESCFLYLKDGVNKYAKKYDSETELYIIEPYIESRSEISVEVLCDESNHRVLTVTDKFLGEEPYFSEVGHCMPSKYLKNELVKLTALAATRALGINLGIAHVEMKMTKNGPFIIEVGCRPAGDGIMDILERSYGYNPYEAHIRSYMGTLSKMKIIEHPKLKSAIAFLHPKPGVVTMANSESIFSKSNHVMRIVNAAQVGQSIEKAKDFSTRQGFVEYAWPLEIEFNFHENVKVIADEIIKTRSGD
ncbi:MAG: ATP-grasp domain-containing protein [Bdellovibrionales bacterium]